MHGVCVCVCVCMCACVCVCVYMYACMCVCLCMCVCMCVPTSHLIEYLQLTTCLLPHPFQGLQLRSPCLPLPRRGAQGEGQLPRPHTAVYYKDDCRGQLCTVIHVRAFTPGCFPPDENCCIMQLLRFQMVSNLLEGHSYETTCSKNEITAWG